MEEIDLHKTEKRIDCLEIAEDFLQAAGGKGKIYQITLKSATMNALEYGQTEKFYYHDVYSEGKYIYDPRFSDSRILESDYFSQMNKMNPEGLSIR